jgi:hypothetical protein
MNNTSLHITTLSRTNRLTTRPKYGCYLYSTQDLFRIFIHFHFFHFEHTAIFLLIPISKKTNAFLHLYCTLFQLLTTK